MIQNETRFLGMIFLFLSAASAQAAPLGTFPTVEEGRTRIEFDFYPIFGPTRIKTKETPVRLFNGAFKYPFLQTGGWTSSFSSSVEVLSLGLPNLTVGENNTEIGPNLRDHHIGFGLQKRNEDQSNVALFTSYDSASDEPYQNQRDISQRLAMAYMSSPTGSRQWVFGLDYNKNRGFLNNRLLPLAGAEFRLRENLRVLAGFPFLVADWRPDEIWSAKLILTPAGIHAEVFKKISHDVSARIRTGLSTRAYAHAKRLDDERRLIYQEASIDAGIRTVLTEVTAIAFGIGYSGQRSFYEAEQVFRALGPRQSIRADVYGGLRVEFFL